MQRLHKLKKKAEEMKMMGLLVVFAGLSLMVSDAGAQANYLERVGAGFGGKSDFDARREYLASFWHRAIFEP